MLYNKTETIKEWNPYIALSCMSTGTFTYYKRDFLTCYFHSKRYIYSHWSFSSSVTNSVLITSCGYCGCRHKKTIKEYNPLLYIMKYEHRTQVLCFVCRVFNCITHIKSIDISKHPNWCCVEWCECLLCFIYVFHEISKHHQSKVANYSS